jgi:hypothetical protein
LFGKPPYKAPDSTSHNTLLILVGNLSNPLCHQASITTPYFNIVIEPPPQPTPSP